MTKYLEFRFFPLIVVVFLVAVYAVSDFSFIQCKAFVQCSEIDGTAVSQIDEKVVHLDNVNTVLTDKLTAYNTKAVRVKDKEGEIEETQVNVDKKAQEIKDTLSKDANANVSVLTNEKTKLESTVKTKREEANTLTSDREKSNSEIAGVRNQVSARYSSRLLWVFLTAVFFVLCVAAIIVSRSVIKDSITDAGSQNKWQLLTIIGAIAFALTVSLPVFLRTKSNYMSIVLPMHEKSIGGNGDISIDVINFINAFGFAATIFLLVASCSIIASVQRKKQLVAEGDAKASETSADLPNETANPSAPAQTDPFQTQKTNARMILYIGGLMLFVGMLRVKLVSDWHLIFVSTDPNNPYYKLLAEFFKSSLAVQAGFYTIILAAIYLPVMYVIQSKDGAPAAKKEEQKTGAGVFSFAEVLPRLIAIISPFLAGPLLDLLKYFTNK